MFYSRSLMFSGLTFSSLVHLEFIFVYGVRECSNFILLYLGAQYSQHHLLKRLSLLFAYFCFLSAKSLQLCPTLCDPIDGSPQGSPIPGILQARTLEWVAISFSNA